MGPTPRQEGAVGDVLVRSDTQNVIVDAAQLHHGCTYEFRVLSRVKSEPKTDPRIWL